MAQCWIKLWYISSLHLRCGWSLLICEALCPSRVRANSGQGWQPQGSIGSSCVSEPFGREEPDPGPGRPENRLSTANMATSAAAWIGIPLKTNGDWFRFQCSIHRLQRVCVEWMHLSEFPDLELLDSCSTAQIPSHAASCSAAAPSSLIKRQRVETLPSLQHLLVIPVNISARHSGLSGLRRVPVAIWLNVSCPHGHLSTPGLRRWGCFYFTAGCQHAIMLRLACINSTLQLASLPACQLATMPPCPSPTCCIETLSSLIWIGAQKQAESE